MAKFRSWVNEASSGRPREFMTVLLLVTIQGFVWQMVIPLIPLLAKSLGAGEIEIGTISVIPAITTIVVSIPGSLLGQKFGKRFLFAASQITGIVCALVLLRASAFSHIYLAQVIFGVSNALFWPTELAYYSEIIPGHMRASVIGYAMAISSIAGIFSPSLGGYLIDNQGFTAAFLVYLAIAAIGCVAANTLPRSQSGESYQHSTSGSGFAGALKILSRPMLRIVILNTFLNSITLGILDVFFPVLLADLGYSAMFIGTTATVRIAGLTLIRFFIGGLANKFSGPCLLFSGLFLCSLASGLVPLAPLPLVVLACSLLAGAGYGLVSVLTPTLIAENCDTSESGVSMALNSTAFNLGRVSGGIGIGWIGEIVGLGMSILAGTAVILAGIAGLLAVYRRKVSLPAGEYRNT